MATAVISVSYFQDDGTGNFRLLPAVGNVPVNEIIHIFIDWDEAVTGFIFSDVVWDGLNVLFGSFSDIDDTTGEYEIRAFANDVDDFSKTSGWGRIGIARDAVEEGNDAVYLNIPWGSDPGTEPDPIVDIGVDLEISVDEDTVYGGQTITARFVFEESVSGFTTGDIEISDGVKGDFSTISGTEYTLEVSIPTGQGSFDISVAEGVITGSSPNFAVTYTVDYSRVGMTIRLADDDLAIKETTTATIEFDENVEGFSNSDIEVSGGSKSNFTKVADDEYTIELTAPDSGDGSVMVEVDADVVIPNNESAVVTYTYAEPRVTITFNKQKVFIADEVVARFVFDRDISGFQSSDVNVVNGTKGQFTRISTRNYTLAITAPDSGDGLIEVEVPADSVEPGNEQREANVMYATPALDISFDKFAASTGDTVEVTFAFERAVTGFTESDITVTGATSTSDFTAVSAQVYTLQIEVPDSGMGTIVVEVGSDSVAPGNRLTQASIDYAELSTIAVTFDPDPLYTGDSLTARLEFNTGVGGFTKSDIAVVGGTAGDFRTISATVYELDITIPDQDSGTVSLTVENNVVEPLNAGVQASISYVRRAELEVTFDVEKAFISDVITATLTFDKDVPNFVLSDLTVSGGEPDVFTKVSDRGYTLTIQVPDSGSGTVQVRVEADVVAQGNNAVTAEVLYAVPTLEITFDKEEVFVSETVVVTFTFETGISGFDFSDIAIANAEVERFIPVSDSEYQLVLVAPTTGSGNIELVVRENSVEPGNLRTEAIVPYGYPSAEITFSATEVFISDEVVVTFTFQADISEFEKADIQVTGGELGELTPVSARVYTIIWVMPEAVSSGDSETLTISLAENVVSPGNAEVSEDLTFEFSDDVPIIDIVDEQTLIVNTDYSMTFNVENSPTTVTVGGLYKGQFDYDWDSSTGECTIDGHPKLLIFGEVWIVTATKGRYTRTRRIIWNVVPAAPVIQEPGIIEVVKGLDFRHTIPIRNNPSQIDVRGLLVGVDFEKSDPGVDIFGNVDTDSEFTVSDAAFDVFAGNGGGDDEKRGILRLSDVGPPSAPRLTGASGGNRRVTLTLEAPISDGNRSITTYAYRYKTTGNYNAWVNTGNTNLSFDVTGLAIGTEYTFQAAARNSEGLSPPSNELTASTDSIGVPGRATSLRVSASGQTVINASWRAPTNDGGSAITGYRSAIRVLGGSYGSYRTSTATSRRFTGLSRGTTYYVQVEAGNVAGFGDSVEGSATTVSATVPFAPTGLRATSGGTDRINLSWNAPSDGGSRITHYVYIFGPVPGFYGSYISTGSTRTSHTVTGLPVDTEHAFKVAAVNGVGQGPDSSTANARTDGVPVRRGSVRIDVRGTGSNPRRYDIACYVTDVGGGTIQSIELKEDHFLTTSTDIGGYIENRSFRAYYGRSDAPSEALWTNTYNLFRGERTEIGFRMTNEAGTAERERTALGRGG